MTRKWYHGIFLSIIFSLGLMGWGELVTPVQAGYEIKEMTPELKSALDGRKARHDELNELKHRGFIGENNRGYVEVLTNDESARGLADTENRDRKMIYQTIAKQHNLTDSLPTIEKVFAQEQFDRAQPGDKIQNENGEWITK